MFTDAVTTASPMPLEEETVSHVAVSVILHDIVPVEAVSVIVMGWAAGLLPPCDAT